MLIINNVKNVARLRLCKYNFIYEKQPQPDSLARLHSLELDFDSFAITKNKVPIKY